MEAERRGCHCGLRGIVWAGGFTFGWEGQRGAQWRGRYRVVGFGLFPGGGGQSGIPKKQEAEGDPKIPLSKKWPTMLQWSSDEEGGELGGAMCMVGGGSTSVSAGCAPVMALGDGFTEGGVGGLDNGLHEEGLEGEEGFGVGSQWDMSSSPGTPDLSWQGQLDYGDEDPGEQDTARVHWGEGKAGPWAASRIASSGWSRRRSGAADASTGRCGGEGIAPPLAAAQKEQRPGPSGRRSKQRGEYSSCVRCSGSGASAVEWGERSEESLEEGELRNSGSKYEWWESRGRGTSNPVRKSLQVQRSVTRRGERRGEQKGGEARTVQEWPPLLSPGFPESRVMLGGVRAASQRENGGRGRCGAAGQQALVEGQVGALEPSAAKREKEKAAGAPGASGRSQAK
ncbi:hypothetical protein NDU88_010503 [Pleurodeles waltl]|uniref:Uncharacterized protein n=1 Tax=Pleurodeles waltl TaxID=8319 RepID=A0AAV7QUJ0_PLEWA|nr:hypothetical protein NDU88_010503 [Pleurodeles waltl]